MEIEILFFNKLVELKQELLETNNKALFDKKIELLNEKIDDKISESTKYKLDLQSDIKVLQVISNDFSEIKKSIQDDNETYIDELTAAFDSFEQKFIEAEEFKMKLLESEINTSVAKTNEYDPLSLKNEIEKDQLLSTLLVGKSKSLNSHKMIKNDKLKDSKTSKWSKSVIFKKLDEINDFSNRGYKVQESINVLKQELQTDLKKDNPWQHYEDLINKRNLE